MPIIVWAGDSSYDNTAFDMAAGIEPTSILCLGETWKKKFLRCKEEAINKVHPAKRVVQCRFSNFSEKGQKETVFPCLYFVNAA